MRIIIFFKKLFLNPYFIVRYYTILLISWFHVGKSDESKNIKDNDSYINISHLSLKKLSAGIIQFFRNYQIGSFRGFVIIGLSVAIFWEFEKNLKKEYGILIFGIIYCIFLFFSKREKPKIDFLNLSQNKSMFYWLIAIRSVVDILFFSLIILKWGKRHPELILLLLLPIYSAGRVSGLVLVPIIISSFTATSFFLFRLNGGHLNINEFHIIISLVLLFGIALFFIGSIIIERYWRVLLKQSSSVLNKSNNVWDDEYTLIYEGISESYPEPEFNICFYSCDKNQNFKKINVNENKEVEISKSIEDAKLLLKLNKLRDFEGVCNNIWFKSGGSKILTSIKIRDKILGILSISSIYRFRFSKMDEYFLNRFRKLFAEVFRKRALQKMLWILAKPENLSTVHKNLFNCIERIIPSTNTFIMTWNSMEYKFVAEAACLDLDGSIKIGSLFEKGSFTYLLKDRDEPLLINDCENSKSYNTTPYIYISQEKKLKSFLGTPLFSVEENINEKILVGALVLVSDKMGFFTEEDKDFLKQASTNIGPVVRSALSYRHQQKQLEDIWFLVEKELEGLNPNEIYKHVVDWICKLLYFKSGLLALGCLSNQNKSELTVIYKTKNLKKKKILKTEIQEFYESHEKEKVFIESPDLIKVFVSIIDYTNRKVGILYLEHHAQKYFDERKFSAFKNIIQKQLTFVVKTAESVNRLSILKKFGKNLKKSNFEKIAFKDKELELLNKVIKFIKLLGIAGRLIVFYRFSAAKGCYNYLHHVSCKHCSVNLGSNHPDIVTDDEYLGSEIGKFLKKPAVTFLNQENQIWHDKTIKYWCECIGEVSNIAIIPEFGQKHLNGVLLIFDKHKHREKTKEAKNDCSFEPFNENDKKNLEYISSLWSYQFLANKRIWLLRILQDAANRISKANNKIELAEIVTETLVGERTDKPGFNLGYAAAEVSFVDYTKQKIVLGNAKGYKRGLEPRQSVNIIDDVNSLRAFILKQKDYYEITNITQSNLPYEKAISSAISNNFRAIQAQKIFIGGNQPAAILTVCVRHQTKTFNFGDEARTIIKLFGALIGEALTRLARFDAASTLSLIAQQLFPLKNKEEGLIKILYGIVCNEGLGFDKAMFYKYEPQKKCYFEHIKSDILPPRKDEESLDEYLERQGKDWILNSSKPHDTLFTISIDHKEWIDEISKDFLNGLNDIKLKVTKATQLYAKPIFKLDELWGILIAEHEKSAKGEIETNLIGLNAYSNLASLVVKSFEYDLQSYLNNYSRIHRIKRPIHDLRLSVLDLIDMLDSEFTKEEQKLQIKKINDALKRISEIDRKFEHYKNLASHKKYLTFKFINIIEKINSIVDEFSDAKIDVITNKIKYEEIYTEPRYFYHTIYHILENAKRFSGNKKIVVTLNSVFDDETKNFKFTISIADKGCGIPQEFLPDEIFEEGFTTSVSGTGMGLFMIKNIAELLDWEIWVKSKVDHGTTFYISFLSKTKETIHEK